MQHTTDLSYYFASRAIGEFFKGMKRSFQAPLTKMESLQEATQAFMPMALTSPFSMEPYHELLLQDFRIKHVSYAAGQKTGNWIKNKFQPVSA